MLLWHCEVWDHDKLLATSVLKPSCFVRWFLKFWSQEWLQLEERSTMYRTLQRSDSMISYALVHQYMYGCGHTLVVSHNSQPRYKYQRMNSIMRLIHCTCLSQNPRDESVAKRNKWFSNIEFFIPLERYASQSWSGQNSTCSFSNKWNFGRQSWWNFAWSVCLQLCVHTIWTFSTRAYSSRAEAPSPTWTQSTYDVPLWYTTTS